MQTTVAYPTYIVWIPGFRDFRIKQLVRGRSHYFDRNGEIIQANDDSVTVVDELGVINSEDAISQLVAEFPRAAVDRIHLAPTESSGPTMERIAREHFEKHPECDFVEVYKRDGWFLGFRRDLSIWSTANQFSLAQRLPQPINNGNGRTIRR